MRKLSLPSRSTAKRLALCRRRCRGFFEGAVDVRTRQPIRYRVAMRAANGAVTDPYTFGPVLGRWTTTISPRASHLRLFDKLGAHLIEHEGASRRAFRRLGAECAARLGRRRLQRVGRPPPSDALAPGYRHLGNLHARHRPKAAPTNIEIIGADGAVLPLKADPFAFPSELRPATASVTARPLGHNGATRRIALLGAARTRAASRSRSMKCMPARGGATTTAGS